MSTSNEQYRDWYEKNKEKVAAQKRAWRAAKADHYRQKARERYAAKNESIREQQRAYYMEHPERLLLSGAKQRAKRLGLPFNLEDTDIVIPTHCPLLEIELVKGVGSIVASSPSLDRIIPDKGYVKGNVWVISARANQLKLNASFEELQLLCKNLAKIHAC